MVYIQKHSATILSITLLIGCSSESNRIQNESSSALADELAVRFRQLDATTEFNLDHSGVTSPAEDQSARIRPTTLPTR